MRRPAQAGNWSFFSGKGANGQSLARALAGLSLQQDQDLMIIYEFVHQLGLIGLDNADQRYTLSNGQTVIGSDDLSHAIRDHCMKNI
jgi:hypothetical protein